MLKIVTVLFYALIGLFFLHVAVPFLPILLGICALVLAITSAL